MQNKISKAWNWNKSTDEIWFIPCEESYYLINRWKEKGFNNFLDLGCGRGRHSIQFAKAGFNVKAIDLSPVAIEGLTEWANKENLSVKTQEKLFNEVGYRNFDLIFKKKEAAIYVEEK
ncbi:class I SAM-dependent methyltransferase [Halothermothrix orenii]|uniref:Tellurite resistance protein TehB n=1 Tax=Halothermothrix orenii (strain H 168 / OCM 544 / DSM 9562) TaxID=373903 RepID=B8CXT7_HALOH|nr:methyltransferase domain-containing protein [Halothermothrix orenii]ACL70106.1 Tellurite resistance protein TehB [Halothermothrix orenii H 168]